MNDKAKNLLGVYTSIGDKVLSHYEIRERIGEGGLAQVYKAWDTRLERWVAIKSLQPWAMGHTGLQRRLIREAQLASALSHPNIVTIHEVAEENGVGFIVMEYVRGKTLDALIPRRGFSIEQAVRYALQVSGALHAAQEADILHGDLKPPNIMVAADGRLKVLDFGLAKAVAGSRKSDDTRPWERFGTKAYMAPERLRNWRRGPTLRSEIFSFGLILHQMVSGQHAFNTDSQAQPDAIVRESPNPLPPETPAFLARIIRRCLEKNPKKRFQSMRDLHYALEKCDVESAGRLRGRKASVPMTKNGRAQQTSRSARADMPDVRAFLAQADYQNIARSRRALARLQQMLAGSLSPAARDAVALGMRELIVNAGDSGGGLPLAARELRKQALEILKIAAQGKPHLGFKDRDLEYLDLYGMNFAGVPLAGISFRECFLVEANFERCQLTDAIFAGAYIRNADFTGAELLGTDFTGADWFNAIGLRENQVQGVRENTVLACPANIRAMHGYLKGRYGFPFESWTADVQEQLKNTWDEYLRPGGLRDYLSKRRPDTR